MGRPYSEDLRSRMVAAVEGGMSRNAVAKHFAVSVSCVVKLMQRFRRTGSIAPAARGRKPFALAEHEMVVRDLVAAQPDLTLDELTQALADRDIHVGRSSVNRFVQACGLTFKKSRFTRLSNSGRMWRSPARLGVPGSLLSTRTG
jgi:transposase